MSSGGAASIAKAINDARSAKKQLKETRRQVQFEYRNFNKVNDIELESNLQQADWHALYISDDINFKLEYFNSIILSIFDKHCPVQRKRKGKSRPGWLTFTLKKIINLKNKAYRDFKRTPTDSKKLYYLELKNYLCTAIKEEKKSLFFFTI